MKINHLRELRIYRHAETEYRIEPEVSHSPNLPFSYSSDQ